MLNPIGFHIPNQVVDKESPHTFGSVECKRLENKHWMHLETVDRLYTAHILYVYTDIFTYFMGILQIYRKRTKFY